MPTPPEPLPPPPRLGAPADSLTSLPLAPRPKHPQAGAADIRMTELYYWTPSKEDMLSATRDPTTSTFFSSLQGLTHNFRTAFGGFPAGPDKPADFIIEARTRDDHHKP